MYEQVARVGNALSSPKRIELLELLAQSEKSVDDLANELGIDIKLASAHLRSLRQANLVLSRRDGKRVFYRLSGQDVAVLAVFLKQVARNHLLELDQALRAFSQDPGTMTQKSRKQLLSDAKQGNIIMLDVRPDEEFLYAHLPYARSIPLKELAKRLKELPEEIDIVAYCRGPYCKMSEEAVALLRARGLRASVLAEGVSEWKAAGLALSSTAAEH